MFDIISFGSHFTSMSQTGMIYNDGTMNDALGQLSFFSADMGGTEIYNPIEFAFKMKIDKKYNKKVFLLTDGGVERKENVINLIKKHSDAIKVHTFGLGTGVDKDLV